jgi:hypothetical protein
MRNLRELDDHRISAKATHGWDGDGTCGAFRLPSPIDGQPLAIIASSGDGWDHVSVSRTNRCPNWPEMEFVKRRFFQDDETVMQLHVPIAAHINAHPNCLHLWRPQTLQIPRPPGWMVGPDAAIAGKDTA